MAGCDICVSGLPSNIDDSELCELFRVFGAISSTKISHQGSQCVSFISFQLPEAAVAAAAAMKGFNHKGASLQVRMAGYTQAASSSGTQVSQQRKPARTKISDQRRTGCIMTWKGSYGWIAADSRIDHPCAAKHEGAVFLSKQDVSDSNLELKEGARVSFITYVDHDGIGAAEVRIADTNDASHNPTHAEINLSNTTVFVSGWPPSLEDVFQKTFEHFGKVLVSKVSRPKQDSRASGHVQFVTAASAKQAINAMNGKLYGGKPLRVWVESDNGDHSACIETPKAAASFPAPSLPSQIPGSSDIRSFIGEERLTGTVRAWKGSFGWLSSDKPIIDPPNAKHKGTVFVSKSDLVGIPTLQLGDRVSFKLYTDKMGNGAADVQPLQEARNRRGLKESSTQQGFRDGVDVTHDSDLQIRSTTAQHVTCWWHQLAGDCCPLSLTPLEELEYEPFGLSGSCVTSEIAKCAGLWGEKARKALPNLPVMHWFDGRFLACSLVSKGQLLDPVNRRPLTRAECVSLDAYLASNGLPVLDVASAWDLSARAEGKVSVDGTALAIKALDEPVAPSVSHTSLATDTLVGNDCSGTVARKGRRWGRER